MRMMTSTLFLALLLANDPGCLDAYGTTACGYDCTAAYGKVRCAQTPAGRCLAAYGQVVCADPPVRAFESAREPLPRMECEAAYGQIACGYSCVAAYGVVRCASVPDGLCRAAYGQVSCWEPSAPFDRLHARERRRHQRRRQ